MAHRRNFSSVRLVVGPSVGRWVDDVFILLVFGLRTLNPSFRLPQHATVGSVPSCQEWREDLARALCDGYAVKLLIVRT